MHFSVWSSPLSGHEVLAFYIAKIPNVTVILAVNRAPMSHISRIVVVSNCTGKSVSEALILESVNQQYDKRLFIEFPKKYKFTTCCVQILFWMSKQKQKIVYVRNMFWACSFHVRTGKSMNNLLPYCGLVDARISASEKN